MPFPVKLGLSLLILIGAACGYAFQDSIGQNGPKYAVLLMGVVMLIGMWIFPEVAAKKPAVRN